MVEVMGARQEKEKEHEEEDPEITRTSSKGVFTAQLKPLNFVYANDNFLSTTTGCYVAHRFMENNTLHLCQNNKQQRRT